MATLFVSLACASGLTTAATAQADTACANADALPSVVATAELEASTLCLLNEQRAAAGLVPVTTNGKLEIAAREYSATMVRDRFFAHVSPTGSTMAQRLEAVSYTGRGRGWFVGENIGWATGGKSTPRGMVDAWMNSPGHRQNILDGQFREIGIGVVTGTPTGSTAVSAATYTTEFGVRTADTAFKNRKQAGAARKAARKAKAARRAKAARKARAARHAKAARRA